MKRRKTNGSAILAIMCAALVACTDPGSTGLPPGPGCGGEVSGPGALVAMDPESGEELWHAKVGNPSGVAEFDQVLVVASWAGTIRAFDRTTGEVRWCQEGPAAGGEQWSGLVEAGGRVVRLDTNTVVALDPDTGTEIWRRDVEARTPIGDSPESTLAPSGLHLVGGSLVWILSQEDDLDAVEVLDPSDGNPVDPKPPVPPRLPSSYFGVGRGVSVAGLSIAVTQGEYDPDRQAMMVATVDAQTGRVLTESEIPGFFVTLAPSSGGPLIVAIDQTGGTGDTSHALDSRVTAYSASDQEWIWQVALSGTPLLVTGANSDTVVVSTETEVSAYDAATGTSRWVVDHGSPGKGGDQSSPGGYWFFTSTEGPIVGLVVAELTASG